MPSSQELTADTRWAHLMRWYVTGGDAAKLGRDCTTVLVVLSAHTDLTTGRVDGLGVAEIAAQGGFGRKSVMKALSTLQSEGYVRRLDDGSRGRRAIWQLRHRTAILTATNEDVGIASWDYSPMQERQRHRQLEMALEAGVVASHPDLAITIHQHVTLVQQVVEPGGTGVINIGSCGSQSSDPDLIGRAVAILANASASDRLRWRRAAVERGAPSDSQVRPEPKVLAGWAGWIAADLLAEARR